jgi:inosine triphosphate pyrophosphatase
VLMLYFITGNQNKLQEAKMILGDVEGYEIDLPEIQEINPKRIIEAKLKEGLKHKKGQFIVEDTSLYLDALNGLPGPLIKWFLKTIGGEGLYNIAKSLNNLNAQAITMIGYAKDEQQMVYFEGVVNGLIVPPKVQTDFGWDNIFQPEGFGMSFAEMGSTAKNAISMRRQALEKLKEYLEKENK